MKKKLGKKYMLWGIADVGEGLVAFISGTYLSFFMTDVALIPLSITSVAMFVMSASDFILASTAGTLILMLPEGRWGRLRSYLLVCPVIAAVFFVIHFISFGNNIIITALVITAAYILARCMYNLTFVANLSLINVIATNQTEKNQLSSQRMIGSNLGRMLANTVTPVLITLFAVQYSERALYPMIMAGGGVIYILFNWVHFWLAGNREKAANDYSELKLRDVFSALVTNAQLFVIVLIDLTSNVTSIVLPALAVYYYKYVFQQPQLTALHMLLTGVAALGGAMLVRIAGSKIQSPRKILLFVYPIIAIFIFGTRFCTWSPFLFMGANIIFHGLTGTTQPFELSLYMDNVTYIKNNTGKDMNSLVMGFSNMTVKIANIIKSLLIPITLMLSGYVAGEANEAVKLAIINAYSIFPMLFPLLGFFLLRFCYKLTK